MNPSPPLFKCQTCGKYWSGETTGCFEVNSEDGLVKCPECMTAGNKEKKPRMKS